MKIKEALTKTESIAQLEPIIISAKTDIDFWGKRYVFAPKYDGYTHINELAASILDLLEKKPEFNKEDRVAGEKITKKINQLYEESNSLIKTKNFFTRWLCYIRDYWHKNIENCGYGIQFRWEEEQDFYLYYSESQLKKSS